MIAYSLWRLLILMALSWLGGIAATLLAQRGERAVWRWHRRGGRR